LGKVRSAVVKRYAWKLFKEYPDLFTKDFEKNKQILKEICEIDSKKIRNQIAGYLVVLKKRGEAGTLFK